MKKLFLTGAMLFALSGAAFAQGKFYINNTIGDNNGLTVNVAGNWYSGTFSVEVWLYAASGTLPTAAANAINLLDQTSGTAAYTSMISQFGFTKAEYTAVGQSTYAAGTLALATPATLPDITSAGTVTIALAIWNNSQTSWANMLAAATGATRAGVTVFNQAVTTGLSSPNNISTWNGYDLVMTPVPEPGTFALAGLGAAALVIFRRRK